MREYNKPFFRLYEIKFLKLKYITLLFLILTTQLLTGCAKPPVKFIPLTADLTNQVRSTNVLILKSQDILKLEYVDPPPNNHGLLGALIQGASENYVKKELIKKLSPINNELVHGIVEAGLQKRFTPILMQAKWMNVADIRIVNLNANKDLTADHFFHYVSPRIENDKYYAGLERKLINEVSTDAVAIIKPIYYLTPDFSTLKIQIELNVYPTSTRLKDIVNVSMTDKELALAIKNEIIIPIYRTTIDYSKSLQNKSFWNNKNVAEWTKNDGHEIKLALDEGITYIANILQSDLQNPSEPGVRMH